LHGGHTPADSDGYPLQWITRGQQQTFHYPNIQLPTTLWYHDHVWTRTRVNVYSGLAGKAQSTECGFHHRLTGLSCDNVALRAGFYLLRDENEAKLGLPRGDYEIPMAIQDRVILEDGQVVNALTNSSHSRSLTHSLMLSAVLPAVVAT
jgi:spore coat protein A